MVWRAAAALNAGRGSGTGSRWRLPQLWSERRWGWNDRGACGCFPPAPEAGQCWGLGGVGTGPGLRHFRRGRATTEEGRRERRLKMAAPRSCHPSF